MIGGWGGFKSPCRLLSLGDMPHDERDLNYRDIEPNNGENQMEKNMENEMTTGGM